MNKKIYYIFIVAICSFLIACSSANDDNDSLETDRMEEENTDLPNDRDEDDGDEDQEQVDQTSSNESATNDDQNDMEAKLQDAYFKKFSLEVEYTNAQEYEAEIDRDDGIIQAKIDDDLTGNRMQGKEAFDLIFDLVNDLSITPDTSKKEIFSLILTSFELPEDYEEIKVEITFQDGTEREFEEDRSQ